MLLDEHVAKCLEDQQPRPSPPKLELVEGVPVRNAVERSGLTSSLSAPIAAAGLLRPSSAARVDAQCDILVARA